MIRKMMNQALSVVRNEQGIETLEWIAMAFLIIVLVAVVVYPGGLGPAITGVIGNVTAAL